MISRAGWVAIGVIAVAGIAVALLVPIAPSPVKVLADSLAATKKTDSVRIVVYRDTGIKLVTQGDAAVAAARATTARAAVLEGLADSLETFARTRDSSAKAWQDAHDARKRQADSLKVANDSLDRGWRDTRAAYTKTLFALDSVARPRIAALERLAEAKVPRLTFFQKVRQRCGAGPGYGVGARRADLFIGCNLLPR